MEQIQPQQRRAAEQGFQQSLNQLEDILQQSSTEEKQSKQVHTDTVSEVQLEQDLTDNDLADLEDAVADIEQYLQERTKTKSG